MTVTDAQLRAYLAGEAPQSVADSIEAAVATDDALAERLAQLDPLAGPVRDAFAGLPVAGRLPEMEIAQRNAPRSGMALAASLAIGLVLGGAGFWAYQSNGPAPQWQVAVAQYQALYAPETIAPLVADEALLEAQFLRASDALGRELDAQSMAQAVPELELKRAQILNHDGAALIQIVFADVAGRPIAFCLLADDALSDQPWQSAELSGLQSISTHDAGLGVMLVGDRPEADLNSWAQALRATL